MTIPKRSVAIALGVAAVVLSGRLPLVAQEPGAPKGDAPAAKKKYRVPDYFGQIGLTDQQRASIQAIQVKRHEKIDALEKQVAAEKAALLAECEGVLTDTQKKLLENLRRAAAESATRPAEAKKPAEPPKSD